VNTIIKQIFQDNTFEKDKSELLYSKLKKIDLKRGAFLLKADDEVHDLYYVHSRCLRSYFSHQNG
jgi:CRP-like cAMP-binding protein